MEVEPGIEGLIHISDISWEKIKHPSQDKLEVGQEAEAVILNIDVEKQKVSLGIKQLGGDIWEDFFTRQKVGDLVKVRIVRIVDFGVFVEITPGIEGVVFLSELDEKKIDNAAEAFSVGEERNAKIIKMNPREKKISLSFRLAQLEMQKLEYQKYHQQPGQPASPWATSWGIGSRIFGSPKKEAKDKEEKMIKADLSTRSPGRWTSPSKKRKRGLTSFFIRSKRPSCGERRSRSAVSGASASARGPRAFGTEPADRRAGQGPAQERSSTSSPASCSRS